MAIETRTVLIADDDVALANALTRHLALSGWRVLAAHDGKEAVSLLAGEEVLLAICDDQMPELTGRQVLRHLRDAHPGVGRILMTGHPSLESAMGALNEQEAHRYIAKPFDLKALDRAIEQTLEAAAVSPKPRPTSQHSVRRSELLAQLEEEYPGLTLVQEGPVHPVGDALGEELVRLARSGALVAGAVAVFDGTRGVVQTVEQLLVLLHQCGRHAVILEPFPNEVRVVMDTTTSMFVLDSLANELGDAMAARLAILAGLNLAEAGNQQGQIFVSHEDTTVEMLVSLRTSAIGLAVEVRQLHDVSEQPLAPNGDQGFGPYRIGEVLGEGGIGTVYRGLHVHLDRQVAIKIMKGSSDKVAAARLLREARAATRARHEGVVEVLDYGRLADNRPFIVMELIGAPTLEWLLTPGAMPAEQAVTIARNIALAIGAAHDAGVIHRDLKPSNIFVDESNQVKVGDFGAAKILNDMGPALTSEGMTIGTPHYMSPEQARGQPVDRRSDIYALGCILFEMLSGSPPFKGTDSMEVITGHVLTVPPPVTSPHGPLSLSLVRTVTRALSKQRSERHQNTQEFVGDLDQSLIALRRRGWRKWLQ